MRIISKGRNEKGELEITLSITGANIEEFLDKEERLAELLNEAGLAATAHLLEESDVNESRMSTTEEKVLYRKGRVKKNTKRPTEP